MAIDTMRLVRIETQYEHVFPLLEIIYQSTGFHPELSSKIVTDDNGGLVYPSEKIYESFFQRLEKLSKDLNLTFTPETSQPYTKDEIEQAISKIELLIQKHYDPMVERTLEEDDKLAIHKLHEYPVDKAKDGYIALRFGKLSNAKAARLYMHKDEPFIFTRLHNTKRNTWIVAVSHKDDAAILDKILDDVEFVDVEMPSILKENVDDMTHTLLDDIYGYVYQMTRVESALKYVSVFNRKAVITGFLSENDVDDFKAIFDDRFKFNDFPAESEENLMPPTKLTNHWFYKPFKMFVQMYGLPKYGSFDPTPFFAITYSLLFGIMFGDVGQGLVLLLLGIYMSKKSDLGGVLVRISFFSMFFGFLYGSFFGNETLLEPLLHPLGLPIHVAESSFTMTLLISAVILGVILILSSMGINIFLGLKEKNIKRAIFNQNGLAGFVLYGYIMVGLGLSFMGVKIFNPVLMILCIGLPLMMILFTEPLTHLVEKVSVKPKAGWGSYMTESIFELLEVGLSFVANTMSFLRVGGFVLSHAGMMAVVMTLMDMSGSGSIVVLIFGNALVIALEGLIVGIQTLRLEYYEMFSRYYEGGGKKFKTL